MTGSIADAPPPDGSGRIVLVYTSPRVAAGLMSWSAWQALHASSAVFAVDLDPSWGDALYEAGITVQDLAELPVGQRAGTLVERAMAGVQVSWLGSPDGDPGLTNALAEHLGRHSIAGHPPEVELVTGAYDVPGARLLDLVAVMDTLRSPGGCPWDAEQSHDSLLPYLLEETHEVIEAVESGDREHLQEELGDLLLQVLFHARIAQEHPEQPFDIDEVAAGIVAKLVNRHPHVFAGEQAADSDEVKANWEHLKAQEKGRDGLFEGIPPTLPALARAQKMLTRLAGAGQDPASAISAASGDDPIGAELLSMVERARTAGVDAESVLRAALGRLPQA